ncbi:hypothetical protein yinte0001_33860 [Yersinia intermedia ATCC 29909]|nr:hypothetical protein yinte0001_33860 [Yersinia intermedia ATCC 29909]
MLLQVLLLGVWEWQLDLQLLLEIVPQDKVLRLTECRQAFTLNALFLAEKIAGKYHKRSLATGYATIYNSVYWFNTIKLKN